LLAVAVVLGLKSATARPRGLVVGLVCLAIGGLAGDLVMHRTRGGRVWTVLFALPGAWTLAWHAGLVRPVQHHAAAGLGWVRPLVLVTAAFGGAAFADFDDQHRRQAWSPALVAIAAVGIYVTVPDTEQALVLMGVAMPLVVLGWPLALGSVGGVGALPVTGVLAWIGAYEGQGRPGAIVAALACLGLLVAEPAGRWARRLAARVTAPGARGGRAWVEAALVVVADAALVAWVSAVGHRGRPLRAVVLVAPALVAAAAAVAATGLPGTAPCLPSGRSRQHRPAHASSPSSSPRS
jgi:hypothetical protein